MSRETRRQAPLLLWLVLPYTGTVACQQTISDLGSDPRFRRAEEQLAAQQGKLAAIQQAIDDAERRLEETKAQADFQACRAKVKEVRAEVERRKAECVKEIADQNLCLVRNEKRTAEAGLAGCTGGIILTLLSGGTAAWSLAGCTLGVTTGAMSEDHCPTPACANAIEQLTPQVLAERGLSSTPRCGGYAGLVLGEMAVSREGVRLERIGEGTYAAAAGLKPGDIIVAINGAPTTMLAGLRLALDTSHEGKSMRVRFVREGRLYESQATATRVSFNGIEPDLQIGAEVAFVAASYHAGARIASLSAEGPARSAGLIPGDQLLTLSVPRKLLPITIATVDDAERALEDCGPFEMVTFSVSRGAEHLSISVPLEPRGKQESL